MFKAILWLCPMILVYYVLMSCFNLIKGDGALPMFFVFDIFFSLVAGGLSYVATKALMVDVQKEARREFATWLFGLAENLRQANITKVEHELEKAARALCENDSALEAEARQQKLDL